jgi:tellurite resistance protein
MELTTDEKLSVMRFICAFAWADLEIQNDEVKLINQIMQALELDKKHYQTVYQWLKRPPRAEDVDPFTIPDNLKEIILDAATGVILADGELQDSEMEMLELLQNILQGEEESK